MKVTIQSAISADGFISTLDGDSGWVKDDELFEKTAREYGCICLGNTTFTQYRDDLYPMDGIEHIVMSSKPQDSTYANVHYAQTVEQAMAMAKELGFEKLLVIGGSQTNGSFIRAGVVSELILDVHPHVLGTGKHLFGDFDGEAGLALVSVREYPDFVCLSYKVT